MNILYIGSDLTQYEKSRSLEVRVADHIAKKSHFVHLITERMPYYENDKPKNLDVTVLPTISHALGRGDLKKQQKDQILNMDFDIVYGASIPMTLLSIWIAKQKGVPSINQVLDVPVWRFAFQQYKEQWHNWLAYLKASDRIIANTKVTQDIIKEILKVESELIYYGVDTDLAESVNGKQPLGDYMCFVGRLVWDKGLELLFYALKMAEVNYPIKIIGNGPDLTRLLETASLCQLNATFLGGINDEEKFRVIKGSRFGVYPDINIYKSGLFPLESLICDKPCIVSDMPVNRERFSSYASYVTPFDLKALGRRITGMIDHCNPPRGAREWVIKNRSYKQQARRLIEVFEECLKS